MRTLGREDDQSVQVWRNRESMLRLCLGCRTTSTDLKTARAESSLAQNPGPRRGVGRDAWASAGAAAFVPPWMLSRGPLGGLWPPLLAFVLGLLGIMTLRGIASLWTSAPRALSADFSAGPHRFRLSPWMSSSASASSPLSTRCWTSTETSKLRESSHRA